MNEVAAEPRQAVPRSSWHARRAPSASGWWWKHWRGEMRDGCDQASAPAVQSTTPARRPRREEVRCPGSWAPPTGGAAVLGWTMRWLADWCGCGQGQGQRSMAAEVPEHDRPRGSWRPRWTRLYSGMTADRRPGLPRRRGSAVAAASTTALRPRRPRHHLVIRLAWLLLTHAAPSTQRQ